jgi:very-short-patch-repair endonuclease
MLAKSTALARRLRREPTLAERTLWRALRRGALDGLHMRRQHPIDGYVADFACVALKLAIEVDGGVHTDDDQVLYDLARTEAIERRGWQVLRFTNAAVLRDVEAVLVEISRAAAMIRGG